MTGITFDKGYCHALSAAPETTWCFAGILDKLDNAVIVIDTVSKSILFCNQFAEDILASLQLKADYPALTTFFKSKNISIDTSGPAATRTQSIIHNDRIIDFSKNALDDRTTCIFIRDITEKKRLESIVQSVNTMDNLGFIFSGIRHEIGNPLNSIKMTNSVLQKNLERFSLEDISCYIERMASEITRMEYLLKSLKNFSMFEKTDCRPHRLRDFTTTLVDLIETDLEKISVRVDYEEPEQNIMVNIDPRALYQAILNLITNAADALADSSDACIRISTRANGRLAWITIEDNGCGMTSEQLDMLFQPFHTSKPHGNGLGMVITQKLLTTMQSTLDISSVLGRGTTARIGLPLAKTTDTGEHPTPGRETPIDEHNIDG